jgi:RNA polymerase sigma-70 factor (ECF subfamily)
MSSTEYAHPVSFDEVYECLFPVIYRVSFRITGDREIAEDLCHEAFIKLMERAIILPDMNQSKYWLIRVVKNLSFNYEKKRKREKTAFTKLTQLSTGIAESGEKKLIEDEIRSDVQKALDELPYNLRVPLVFREYAGLSYKEIGAILSISENNVKVRVFRARERLEKIFTEDGLYVS